VPGHKKLHVVQHPLIDSLGGKKTTGIIVIIYNREHKSCRLAYWI